MKVMEESCYVNEVTFGKHLWMGAGVRRTKHVTRGLELLVLPPDIQVCV